MFNVITNHRINKKPVTLKEAFKLVCENIYFSDKDKERAKFHFETSGKNFQVTYGFSSVWIERAE
jgi:hypothetical protein